MKLITTCGAMLFSLSLVPAASAQFVAVSGGGLFPQSLSAPASAGPLVTGLARADFTNSGILAVDGGISFIPFVGVGLHYSHSTPSLTLRRGDTLGSLATVDLAANTLTFDIRVNSPYIAGFRGYGFVGGGFTRFGVTLTTQVGVPFPNGVPSTVTAPVVTYGGGLEKKFFPLLRGKFEVRDYLTPISSTFYQPGGYWHRLAILAGIVVGR